MQRDREVREESINSGGLFDSFGSFGSLGRQRSMMSSIFRGRDPFDDPFFTRPFDSMFGPSMFSSGSPFRDSPQVGGSKGPVIEELNTDDEEEEVDNMGAKEDKEKAKKNSGSNKAPHVEHPDDEADERKSKDVTYRTDYNKVEGTKPQARSVSFQKVTHGINGAYYTATTTRKTGGDGVVLEECKQADKTTGQATHRISRGIHDKGHSVTRKLNSDGKVDTMQALHNLNEDELAGFEQSWKGNAERHLPGWDDGFNFNGTAGASSSGRRGRASGSSWPLPIKGFSGKIRTMEAYSDARTTSSGGRPKKVVTINIESLFEVTRPTLVPFTLISLALSLLDTHRSDSAQGNRIVSELAIIMSKLFGGKDPFDDPFFTHPFGGMFGTLTDSGNRSKEVTIEELDSDGNPLNLNHSDQSNKELIVKNPNAKNGTKSFSFKRVAYGGLNGMYYTASVTRKTGDDEVVLMEINEEDKTVGEALNTISRGVHDKGHSVTTKRTSDGKVDTMQTLHNLNEDELVGFEETWKANAQNLPPDWNSGFNLLENADASGIGWDWWPKWGGWALPSTEQSGDAGGTGPVVEAGTSSRGRAKKIVRVNIE